MEWMVHTPHLQAIKVNTKHGLTNMAVIWAAGAPGPLFGCLVFVCKEVNNMLAVLAEAAGAEVSTMVTLSGIYAGIKSLLDVIIIGDLPFDLNADVESQVQIIDMVWLFDTVSCGHRVCSFTCITVTTLAVIVMLTSTLVYS
jgi:hypothetical protein